MSPVWLPGPDGEFRSQDALATLPDEQRREFREHRRKLVEEDMRDRHMSPEQCEWYLRKHGFGAQHEPSPPMVQEAGQRQKAARPQAPAETPKPRAEKPEVQRKPEKPQDDETKPCAVCETPFTGYGLYGKYCDWECANSPAAREIEHQIWAEEQAENAAAREQQQAALEAYEKVRAQQELASQAAELARLDAIPLHPRAAGRIAIAGRCARPDCSKPIRPPRPNSKRKPKLYCSQQCYHMDAEDLRYENLQRGLCRCGRAADKGRSTCKRCRYQHRVNAANHRKKRRGRMS